MHRLGCSLVDRDVVRVEVGAVERVADGVQTAREPWKLTGALLENDGPAARQGAKHDQQCAAIRNPIPLELAGVARRGNEHRHRQRRRVQVEQRIAIPAGGCALPGSIGKERQHVGAGYRPPLPAHHDPGLAWRCDRLGRRQGEKQVGLRHQPILGEASRQRARGPKNDGNAVAAPFHEERAVSRSGDLPHRHPREGRRDRLVTRRLSLRHAFDGQVVGKAARRVDLQTVREHRQADPAALDPVVAMRHRVHQRLENRFEAVLRQVHPGG